MANAQGSSYNIASTYRIAGLLDIGGLRRGLDILVERHETLRTSLRFEEGDVVQVILPKLKVQIRFVDHSDLAGPERLGAALADAGARAAEPFDLETAPLFRASLHRLSEGDHLLALCFHHCVFDGWSEGVFLRELAALYAATDANARSLLPELAIQYADFAEWHRQQTTDAAMAAGLAYWKTQLADAPASLNLPLDRPRPLEPTRRGGIVRVDLSSELVTALEAFSRQQGATLFMTLMAGYSVVLHRYSGDEQVLIGTALAGRTRPEIEPLIGFFVNTVTIRADLRGDPTFPALLARIRQTSLEATSHQDVPFEHVVQTLQPDRRTGNMPLFQVMFAMQNASSSVPSFGDLVVTPLDVHNGTSKCDLVLNIGPHRDGVDGLCCQLEFDTDLFDATTATRFLESCRLVLEGIATEAGRPISMLPLVTEQERSVITAWARTPGEYPRTSSLHREFESVAQRAGTAVALCFESQEVTYEELEAQANQLANRLRREQVQPGELVGVCLDRSIAAIIAQLAILKVGAAYLPLDPGYPSSRLAFMLQDAGVRLVLAHGPTSPLVPSTGTKILDLVLAAESIAGESREVLDVDAGPEDLAYVMYTSGSTGRPNGVRVPHRGVMRLVLGTDYIDWQRATRWLQMAPLSFDASTFEIWGALLHGARLTVFPERVPTLPKLEKVLSAERIDCLWLTAALFNFIVDEKPDCLAHVSQLIIGGEALSVPHLLRAQARLPAVQIINGYGPTECTTFACCHRIPRLSYEETSIPIGRPIGNTAVRVLDRRNQEVPIGVAGELYIGGDGVALGYHDRPDLTLQRFVQDASGEVWYRSGDLVRWRQDGVLDFLGRLDSQLKVRGFRVEPGEIETVCRRHPAVRDAAVLVPRTAAGQETLVAFIAADSQEALSTAEVREFLVRELPNYLVPSALMIRESLPLTPNGKVDRNGLLGWYRESMDDRREQAEQPRSATEKQLCQIWRELFQVETIGVHDDFFAIGGHSLLAVRMFARIHETFNRSLPFSTLLQRPTVSELAAVLEAAVLPKGGSSLVPLKRGGNQPPLFLVHGIGSEVWTFLELVKELQGDQPVYGVLPSESSSSRVQSITEMAATYLAEVEALVGDGRFVLGGYCSGAVIAFEMTSQRRMRGQAVPLLVVFEYWLREEPADILNCARNFFNWIADDLLRTSLKNNFGRIRSRLRLLKTRFRRLVNREFAPDDVRDVLGMWRYSDHEVDRLRRFMDAIAAYRFTRHDGPVHVFRARTRSLRTKHPAADMGWGQIAQGPLTVETVPGSHDSMFAQPFVRSLARRLDAVLERFANEPQNGPSPEQADLNRS